MKRLLSSLAFLLFATTAGASHAPLVDITITDLDTGRTLPLHGFRGERWVAGEPGNRYAVALHNRSGERVLAVLSIDGVNVVTGESASTQQSGYVLGPWERAEIRGWRKSLSEVAEFYFTDLPDSYAARTGRPDDVGVVGMAVFRERVRYIPAPPASPPIAREDRRGRAANGASAQAQAPARAGAAAPEASAKSSDSIAEQEIGTGHGERRYDPVGTTEFVRASSRPDQVVAIRYDAYEALVERGIIRAHRWRRPGREPDPFPIGFVPDPS
ncbi:MAG TPA: hypothetical protein VND91_06040 [Candidatus Saccharimonadia bacterium]|nr:hypothetical protein [Candidatus Saccharimonadia bacterium]